MLRNFKVVAERRASSFCIEKQYVEYRISNIEQGMLNDEVFLLHYSIFLVLRFDVLFKLSRQRPNSMSPYLERLPERPYFRTLLRASSKFPLTWSRKYRIFLYHHQSCISKTSYEVFKAPCLDDRGYFSEKQRRGGQCPPSVSLSKGPDEPGSIPNFL